MLSWINMVSFAVVEANLYLDTAPAGQEQWEWINQPWPWEGGAC